MKRSRLPKNPAFLLLALLFSMVVSPLFAQDNDGIINLFTEGFENGFGQWYADNGVWEIGIPTFSVGTTIAFTLGAPEPVTLKIYDVLGREVATLPDDVILSGKNTLIWNGGGQSSGIYLYRLQTSAMVLTRRMHLVK